MTGNHLAEQGYCVSDGKPLKVKGSQCQPCAHLHHHQHGRAWEHPFLQNCQNLHREFPQLLVTSFLEKGRLTEPETEKGNKCFTRAVRHTWAHGDTRCLVKKDQLSPVGLNCLQPQIYIPDGRGKSPSIAWQWQDKVRNQGFPSDVWE